MFKLIVIIFSLFSIPYSLLPISYAHSSIQAVEMTSEGFAPNEITVDQNQTIIFINKDEKPRWPASNVHPTHEIYPQFDSKEPIKPGKSWVFKPQKVGEWRYHDHLFPHMRGKLVVIDEKASGENEEKPEEKKPNWFESVISKINSLLTLIKNLGSNLPGYKLNSSEFKNASSDNQIKLLKQYSDVNGSEKGWQFVQDTYKGQAGSMGNIHDLAHLSGGLLFDNLGFEALAKCTPQFAFGCYHGFLDKAFAKNLDHLIDAQDACLKLGPDGSGPVGSCIHGIGHGVASFHSSSDLKASLAECRKLTSGRDFCFDGVFMEFVRSAPDSFYRADDHLYPCNDLEKQYGPVYSQACGRNQPSLLLGRFKKGFDEIAKICLDSSSKPFKNACFDSLGFSLASADFEGIIRGCSSIGEQEYMARCAKSAAGELIFQEVPGWQEKAPQICSELPANSISDCHTYIQRLIKDYARK